MHQAYKSGYTKFKTRRDLSTNREAFLKSEYYKRLKKTYRKSRREYKKKLVRKERRGLIRRLIRDQRHRFRKYKPDKQHRLDSINVAHLKTIYNQKGRLPSIEEVGEKFIFLHEPPFLHLDPEDAVFFANILFDMYLKGEYNSINFVLDMLDQVSYRNGVLIDFDGDQFFVKESIPDVYTKRGFHRQSFGKTAITIREEGVIKKIIIPVHDLKHTNEIRKMLGLLSIEEECKINKRKIYDEKRFEDKFGNFEKH